MLTHKELKACALASPEVKVEYDGLKEEIAVLGEFLKARTVAVVTQAEIVQRIGTPQSAIARLESGRGTPSSLLVTLQKYAHALGYHVELRLVPNESKKNKRSASPKRKVKETPCSQLLR
jgi:transcriptional regulator with XRE-family HTH domain